jgi:hypothetical protein
MLKKNTLSLIILLSISLNSQNLRLIDTSNYTVRKELIKKYKAQNEVFYKKLKKQYRGKLRKQIIGSYKTYDTEFIKYLEKNRFIFDERFTNYTDSILKLVIDTNPDLKDLNLKVYVSKNPSINALNIGKGIIVLNIGLFKYFQNEDQLISVLTHEIGHEKLRHVKSNILYRANLEVSESRKTQVRAIKKQKYNTYDTSFKILKELMYSDSKKRRKKEVEADSLGYLIFNKTSLYIPNYISALQLLAKYETLPSIELDSTVYQTFFNIPTQPFKTSWLKVEGFSKYDYSNYKEKINKDSVKSHPEFQERIDKLKNMFSELRLNDSIAKPNNNSFFKLKQLAQKEDIVSLYDLKKYGKSIQLTLYKLFKNPKDGYLKKWLGKNFLGLYEAKKKYQLNRHIERLNPKEQTKEYQQFLSFIWNLNLNEMKAIGDYYSKD